MAVEISVPSHDSESGRKLLRNIRNFSVQEDVTPIEPSSSAGGVGRITFGIDEDSDTRLMIGDVTLVDGSRGKTSGVVRSLSASDGNADVVADSVFGLWNVEATFPPFYGTLGDCIQFYCDFVGIENNLFFSEDVDSEKIVEYPGYRGNVWVHLKEILVVEQIEIAIVFDQIHVRTLRTLTATLDREISASWSITNSNAVRNVEVFYYNNNWGEDVEIYPIEGEDPITLSGIGAGETVVYRLPLNASVISVNQPEVQNFVNDEDYSGTNGVYSVVGVDGLPITALEWTAQGGSLEVLMTDDPNVIEVVVTGASSEDYAPYTIAMSAGSGDNYNSLHITGEAVRWHEESVIIPTGATGLSTSAEVLQVINRFISTLEQALSLGIKAAQANAGVEYTISGSALDINRNDDNNELIRATIADFDEYEIPETTIAEFDVEWADNTIADFDAFWTERMSNIFPNQLFGNAPGARIIGHEANFRVTSATTDEVLVQYQANLDTIISDFDEVWDGMLVEDFDAQFNGYSCKEFSIVPLRRDSA